ncbi:hypothetical protein HHL28_03775 [Aerophototrophica crusticola]|uniref:Uncharacterized protein n=1 Tax=Aerophototrophica crusticola TaxID=1709002 RepID=A0A858R565_9PROT|nr:hypothetical protein HHL28_03775 [Rhodospirillaceae bacterium B3]
MSIEDLEDLRRDLLAKSAEMRSEAERVAPDQPEEAAHLRRIADRLEVYMRDYLEA